MNKAVSELVRIYQFRDKQRVSYYDVSVNQCYAIGSIYMSGNMTQNQLADELHLDKSTTSRLVESLEEKGYVHRHVDPDDGRAFNLEVTEKGKDLHLRIEQDLIDEKKKFLQNFDPDVRKAAIRLVIRLTLEAKNRFFEKKLM